MVAIWSFNGIVVAHNPYFTNGPSIGRVAFFMEDTGIRGC